VSSLMPDQIFISYSHKDSSWMELFRTMLAPAASKGLVDPWSDQRIKPGDDWREEIRDALGRARVALLLVTAEFLKSPFIVEKELRSLLATANDGALRLFWVPISDSLVEYTALGRLQPACDPNRQLASLNSAEQRNMVAEICRKILDDLGQLPVVTRDDRLTLRANVSKSLRDKYEIVEEIGTGATSIVFKARDRDIDRLVAVKTLVSSALQPNGREAFQKQVEFGYSLSSPAFLRIFDHFLDEGPQSVVSEYMEGCGLARYLELARELPPRRTKAILLDLAIALSEAHARGYQHIGLMPSNVFIDHQHRLKISAFCFVRSASTAGRWGTFVINHETCTYLSPEQFSGQPRSQLSDQYSLGLLGRQLLTGKDIDPIHCPADFVNRPQVYDALANEDVGHAHGELFGIVSRMLRVDPAERWSSMEDVQKILNDVVVHDTDLDGVRREVVASYSQLQSGDREKRFYQTVYHHLFELAPALKAYFSEDQMARQYGALNRAIKLLLDYNPAEPKTVGAIREVARHHARYRISDADMDAFLGALLLALPKVGQKAAVVEAWRRIVSPGLDEMRRVLAANEDSQRPVLPAVSASQEESRVE
jgi:serine/threonine protein kinase